jgi:hypothetical protein
MEELNIIKIKTIEPEDKSFYLLKEGPNTFGSNLRNNFVFPKCFAGYAGIFFLKNNKVSIRVAEVANITFNNQPIDDVVIFDGAKSLTLEGNGYYFQIVNRQGTLGVELTKR